jgi:hypothetical protein
VLKAERVRGAGGWTSLEPSGTYGKLEVGRREEKGENMIFLVCSSIFWYLFSQSLFETVENVYNLPYKPSKGVIFKGSAIGSLATAVVIHPKCGLIFRSVVGVWV